MDEVEFVWFVTFEACFHEQYLVFDLELYY